MRKVILNFDHRNHFYHLTDPPGSSLAKIRYTLADIGTSTDVPFGCFIEKYVFMDTSQPIIHLNHSIFRLLFSFQKNFISTFYTLLIFTGKIVLDLHLVLMFHRCVIGILRHSFSLVKYLYTIHTISLADILNCHNWEFLMHLAHLFHPLNFDRKVANIFPLNFFLYTIQRRGMKYKVAHVTERVQKKSFNT